MRAVKAEFDAVAKAWEALSKHVPLARLGPAEPQSDNVRHECLADEHEGLVGGHNNSVGETQLIEQHLGPMG